MNPENYTVVNESELPVCTMCERKHKAWKGINCESRHK